MELEEAIGKFLRALAAADRSERTIHWYSDILRRFQCRGGRLTAESIEEYLSARRCEISHASLAGEHRTFRRFCSWLVTRGYLAASPMEHIARPGRADPPEPTVATTAVVKQLLFAANGSKRPLRDRALLIVLADTGARLSEFLAITMANLQVVHEQHVDYGQVVILGKGRKRRKLLIGPAAMSELAAWITERPPEAGDCIWWSDQGRPLKASGVRMILRRLSARAGLKKTINPHAFRHGFAVAFLEAGGDIRTLQLDLGHADITTTARYLQLVDTSVRQVHHRISRQRFETLPLPPAR
jgi:integrase/recombinase XerD